MKVGEYVRTKDGVIGKYNIVKTGETIPNWNGGYGYKEIDKEYIDNNVYNRFDDKIIKSSPNIIDLIEVGDYVNGEKVIRIFNPTFLSMGELPYVITNKSKYEPQEIQSVLTKETFEQMEYRIGE